VDLVDPDAVSVSNGDGRWVIRIGGQEVDRPDLFHVRAYPWAGKLEGLSPVGYAREAIGLGIAAEKYGAKFFGGEAIPSGVFTVPGRMSRSDALDIKAMWNASHAGRRGTAVLTEGAKFEAISIAPDEAQFIETQRFNVATICRLYGVPPEMMGGETAGHEAYTSPEMRSTDLLTWTLRPWLHRVERAVSGLAAAHAGREVQRWRHGPRDPARPLPGAQARRGGRLAHRQRGPRAGGPPTAARRGRGRMTVLERSYLNLQLRVREDGDGRTLVGPVLPWNVEARVVDRGREVVETFERGALVDVDPARVPLTARHPRDAETLPIGRTVELEDRTDAAWGAWLVSRTALGDEVLELARDGVPLGLSVGFMEVPGGSRWLGRSRVVRTRAALDHVAIVRVPAYAGAGVVGVRAGGGERPGIPLATLARRRR
jgi:phage head maturation protease